MNLDKFQRTINLLRFMASQQDWLSPSHTLELADQLAELLHVVKETQVRSDFGMSIQDTNGHRLALMKGVGSEFKLVEEIQANDPCNGNMTLITIWSWEVRPLIRMLTAVLSLTEPASLTAPGESQEESHG